MVAVKSEARLQHLTLDIRKWADEEVKTATKVDANDIMAMLKRAAGPTGSITVKQCEDLAWVRERYKDKFTAGALKIMTSVLGPFIADQLKQMKESQRRKKIDKQVLAIEEKVEFLKKDRKLRDLNLDVKTRVMLTDRFGRRTAGS